MFLRLYKFLGFIYSILLFSCFSIILFFFFLVSSSYEKKGGPFSVSLFFSVVHFFFFFFFSFCFPLIFLRERFSLLKNIAI